MKLVNLKKANNLEVERWLDKSIPELTPYQRQKIRDLEIVRFAPFEFMQRIKPVSNVLIRISVIALLVTYILLVISLPLNFIITGTWGYNDRKIKWFSKWHAACGL